MFSRKPLAEIPQESIANPDIPKEIEKPIEVEFVDKKDVRTADDYEIIYNPETAANHPYEKWRTKRLLRFMMTREIARYLDRRTFIAISLREAVCYSMFLCIIAIITLGSTPLDMYYLSQAMTTLYTKQKFIGGNRIPISFYEINTMADVWAYQKHVVEKMYHDFWYKKPDPYENPDHSEEYYYENKLIGMPQLRQVRVRNDSCSLHSTMQLTNKGCYGSYSWLNEDVNSFGTMNSPYWRYKSSSKTHSLPIDGLLASYGGGGYVAILQKVGDKAIQTIEQLKHNLWLDRGSRALFLEFTIYNGNVNLFCIFKLIFEFPPTGGVITTHWNYVQKLIRYNDADDTFILICEFIFCGFFIFYTIQKVMEIKTLRQRLLTSFWNWIDLIILVMSYLVVVFNVILYLIVYTQLTDLVDEKNEMNYASFDTISYVYVLYSYSFAILIGFAFFKVLKYLNIVHAMYQLQSTISKATKDILSYCVLFFYVYFVFAYTGLFLFGNRLEDYSTFQMAVFALLKTSVGDFNFNQLVQAEPVLGPIYFFAFIFFIAFIMANVFLAILVSKYQEVRSEVRIGGVKTFIGDMIKIWLLRILEKAECNWLLSQIERKQYEKKVQSPTEAIREYLQTAGYSDLEIELFFKKYDITDSKISAMDKENLGLKTGDREAPPALTQKDILRYIILQKLEYLENHHLAVNKLTDEFLKKLNKFDKQK